MPVWEGRARLDYPIFNPGFCKYIFKEYVVGVRCRFGGAELSSDLSISITSIHSPFTLPTLHFLSFTCFATLLNVTRGA